MNCSSKILVPLGTRSDGSGQETRRAFSDRVQHMGCFGCFGAPSGQSKKVAGEDPRGAGKVSWLTHRHFVCAHIVGRGVLDGRGVAVGFF